MNEYYNESFIGKYHLGRFYFTINTERTKAEVGLSESQTELVIDQQKLLQREFLSTIIHEYIHYLHEISTVVGNMGLGMDITLRSLFSNWIEPDLAGAMTNGNSSSESLNLYSSIRVTKDMLEGDRQDAIIGKFINVKRIDSKSEDIFILDEEDSLVTSSYKTPIIYFDSISSSIIREEHLNFGKFFLYEGIAYELDRVVDQKLHQRATIEDSHKGTEYTVMRRVAQYIFPDVEKRVYITLGVLSLQYPECGLTFIEMLNEVKEKSILGIDQNITLDDIKNKVSQLLLNKLQEFEEQQFEYQSILLGRRQLYKAMSFLRSCLGIVKG